MTEQAPEQDLLHVFTRAFGVHCPACEYCPDDAPCQVTDSCPMTWCACHVPGCGCRNGSDVDCSIHPLAEPACPCHNGADDQCDQHGGTQ